MTLIIDLPEEDAAVLSAKALAHGVSAEQYACQILKREIQQVKPIAARIREMWNDMPDEVMSKLPSDGASEVEHYVYGLPKREK